MKFVWKICSRAHDWRHEELLHRFVMRLIEEGLLQPPDWLEPDWDKPRKPINFSNDKEEIWSNLSFENIEEAFPVVSFGYGDNWSLIYSLTAPPEEDYFTGINQILLEFEINEDRIEAAEELLRQGFTDFVDTDYVEYALLHPVRHYHGFGDKAYPSPVTAGSLFAGVFWANFLGAPLLDHFDRRKLSDFSEYNFYHERKDSAEIFIHDTDLLAISSGMGNHDLKALTKRFRRALKKQSPWR